MAKKKRSGPPPVVEDPHTQRMAAGDAPSDSRERVRTRVPDQAPAKAERASRQTKLWDGRLERANKVYDAWSKKFECQHLDDYYEGQQWRGVAELDAQKKYVINMVFATVETQLPSLLFANPKVNAEARPDHQETDTSQAGARATLVEQALQTFIDDPKLQFGFETTLALRDAYSRFGLVEVGYSGDWIDNPNAGKPMLKEDNSPMLDQAGAPVLYPAKRLQTGTKESLYVRRLPPWAFRASPGHNRLSGNDWVAYYEWVQLHDVKTNPAYQHTETLEATGTLITTSDETKEREDLDETVTRVGMVKLWKIFDLRAKRRHVHAEGHKRLLQTKPFTYLPLAVMKFFERKDAFYPLPPIYNWMSPQDEINETREMQKVHRRRALRRYMHEPNVTAPTKEKLESTEDMLFVEVPSLSGGDPIRPIQDAPLDAQNWSELAATKEDLNLIAGVSGESRGTPSAPTATQANIMNSRATVRETAARHLVALWLGEIARLMLLTLRERMKLPFMVKRSIDPFAFINAPEDVRKAYTLWKEITSEDIDDLDVDIKIDVASLSPVAEEAQRNQWNVVLTLLTNPSLATLLMTPNPNAPQDPSPLLRKTLVLNGITSDQEIREIWRVGQAILAQAADAAASQAALAKQGEPPKVSIALKGEDLLLMLGPIDGPAYVRSLVGLGPAADAAAMSRLMPATVDPAASGATPIPGPRGPATGVPVVTGG